MRMPSRNNSFYFRQLTSVSGTQRFVEMLSSVTLIKSSGATTSRPRSRRFTHPKAPSAVFFVFRTIGKPHSFSCQHQPTHVTQHKSILVLAGEVVFCKDQRASWSFRLFLQVRNVMQHGHSCVRQLISRPVSLDGAKYTIEFTFTHVDSVEVKFRFGDKLHLP